MLKGQLDAATLFLLCRVMIETPHLKLGRLVPLPYHVPPPYFASLPRLNRKTAIPGYGAKCVPYQSITYPKVPLLTLCSTKRPHKKSPVETGLKIIDSVYKKPLCNTASCFQLFGLVGLFPSEFGKLAAKVTVHRSVAVDGTA